MILSGEPGMAKIVQLQVLVDADNSLEDEEVFQRLGKAVASQRRLLSLVDWSVSGVFHSPSRISHAIEKGEYVAGSFEKVTNDTRLTFPLRSPYWIDILEYINTGVVMVTLGKQGTGTECCIEVGTDSFNKVFDALMEAIEPLVQGKAEEFGLPESDYKKLHGIVFGLAMAGKFFPDMVAQCGSLTQSGGMEILDKIIMAQFTQEI
jgi:hypothetical protein